MKKGYILVFIVLWIIAVFLLIGVIVLNIFPNVKDDTQIKVSEENQIIDNSIQIVTTMANDEEKETVYIIKDYKGNIAIYVLDEKGKEHLREITHIVTMYLPEIDKQKLQVGIRVTGKEELNKTLEDYE